MILPPGFEQQSISTSLGRMVYYTNSGSFWDFDPSNKPTLVFLHGFGGGSSAYEWSKVFPAFASDYRILAPDLLGWGRSEHPERNYLVEDYLKTIAEFLEQTCTAPVPIIASSLTGGLAIRLAITRSELFQSLIAIAPSGLSDFGNSYSSSFLAQLAGLPYLNRWLYATAIATPGGIRNFLEQRQFAQPNRIYSEIVEAYLASAKQTNAESAALSFLRGDLSFDLALYISQLQVPTAILWGEKSQFTNFELGKRLAALNPAAIRYCEVIPDVGLTPQLELPAVTIGLIRHYLQDLA
ncbi:alpha/beta hydrolase [Merismopedia glauca CCAP 1448/3]|uniref:Alpha/beta hydrolase n=2 Tax=Merismopedia TaxID=53402 RepID=A0A2T1C316_9CYAN|nr:alpha/beta hydrolase [Merismopedia glauca CCAP 1448/3]